MKTLVRSMRAIPLVAGLALLAIATCAAAPPQTSAPASATTHNHTLAPVGVTGAAAIKGAVRALQEIKVALKRPISSDPADANLTVCQLEHQSRGVHAWERMNMVLVCGSNSWWLYRQDNCQMEGIAACAEGLPSSAHKSAGMWHNMRVLNFRQAMALRKLTDTLPPPSSTRTIIVTGYRAAPTGAPTASSKP